MDTKTRVLHCLAHQSFNVELQELTLECKDGHHVGDHYEIAY